MDIGGFPGMEQMDEGFLRIKWARKKGKKHLQYFFWGGLRRLDPLFWEAWLLRMLIGSYRWLDFVDGIYTN